MLALQLTRWKHPAELTKVPVPRPGPGQVLIRIAGSGVCHSDLHLMDWPEGQFAWKLPFTLGHENAGWVEELGAGVSGLGVGAPVLVYGPWGCGACHACRLGRENYCDRAADQPALGGGLGTDGGMAEYMLVPSARLLVPIDGLDPATAAPLADAGLTPYHAIAKARAQLVPGSVAVVIGTGGLGQMAIQLLRATTAASIVALDSDPHKLALARACGADDAVLADAGAASTALARHEHAAAVFDFVGSDATLALGAKLLRPEGRLVIVGLAGGTLPVSFFAIPNGAEVATSYWGTLPELHELVALARAGKVKLEAELFPLARAAEVYDRLRRGEVRGRAVIVPGERPRADR